MMLGKRSGRQVAARHHMRRTTSMTEFTPADVLADVAEEEDEELHLMLPAHAEGEAVAEAEDPYGCAIGAETAAFLRACGLCNRRLGPGQDTFMYRGDTAFCSLECRQQHITIEEWKEKCALATPQTAPAAASDTGATTSARSDKPGTLAVA